MHPTIIDASKSVDPETGAIGIKLRFGNLLGARFSPDKWGCAYRAIPHATHSERLLCASPCAGKKFFAYGNMTVVLGETVVTITVAQLMCLFIGGMDEWRSLGAKHVHSHRVGGSTWKKTLCSCFWL